MVRLVEFAVRRIVHSADRPYMIRSIRDCNQAHLTSACAAAVRSGATFVDLRNRDKANASTLVRSLDVHVANSLRFA